MLAIYSDKTVFVVSIPWDSHSVKQTHVFKNHKDAEAFCTLRNEHGYGGFTGGLCVEECQIIISVREDTDKDRHTTKEVSTVETATRS